MKWVKKSANTQSSASSISTTTTSMPSYAYSATGSISLSPYGYSIMGSIPITFRQEEYDIDKHKGHFITLVMSDINDGLSLMMGGAYFRPYCLDCKEFVSTKSKAGEKQDLTNGKGKEVFSKEEVKLENEELKTEI